jgi:hypothetical protein
VLKAHPTIEGTMLVIEKLCTCIVFSDEALHLSKEALVEIYANTYASIGGSMPPLCFYTTKTELTKDILDPLH